MSADPTSAEPTSAEPSDTGPSDTGPSDATSITAADGVGTWLRENGRRPGDALETAPEHALALLKEMLRVRRFEERCAELYAETRIRGFLHLYIGEEAVAVGVMQALGPDDSILCTYREHGHALVRGVPATAVMAEMFGKYEGCSRGRGGSMHLFSVEHRLLGGNAIVGGHLPVAVGLALADALQGRARVTACFFGEGAMAEGEFHEALNLAALWNLPVLFCCENNYYAMGTALTRSESEPNLCLKAASYEVTAWPVDGMDVLAVERAARHAAATVREGGGPVFLELRTYRFRPHSMFDPELYRDQAEVEAWKAKGPIRRFDAALRRAGLLDDAALQRIEDAVAAEIQAAVDFAEAGSWEPVEQLTRWVSSDERPPVSPPPAPLTNPAGPTTLREAVRLGMREALLNDDRVFLMGEDVGRYGGTYACSKGFLDAFGPARIRDTPLSESGFVGAGIGAALGGLRPIVEVMTVNFSLLCLDQVLNNAATLLHMSGGQLNVPLVIRMATGAGRQLAAQHSHSLEGYYAHIPGIRVVAPATLEDARGMLWTALGDPDPVVIFEHAALYNLEATLAPDAGPVDLDRAAVRRLGDDVTVVAYSAMVHKALAAAEALAGEGISVEVVDLRTLRPLDDATVMASVHKTHRALVLDEAWRSVGIAAEVCARIQEQAFFDLDAPVARLCGVEVPVPYPRHLEQAAVPQVEDIVAAARRLVTGGEGATDG